MNRKGFSVRNLRNMRLIYLACSIHQISDELTWTRYAVSSSTLRAASPWVVGEIEFKENV